MCVIDFTNSIEKVCEYGGSEKKKKFEICLKKVCFFCF